MANILISTADAANSCNKTTLTLLGSGSPLETLNRMARANDWTDLDIKTLASYTDGYRAVMEQTIGTDLVASKNGGTCLVMTNGTFCHSISTTTTSKQIDENGHNLVWWTATNWASVTTFDLNAATTTKSTKLSTGLVVTPAANAVVTDGGAATKVIQAMWY